MTQSRVSKSKPIKKLRLEIAAEAAAARPHVGYLRRHVRAACGLIGSTLHDLSIALVGDARMAALHGQFSGVSGPTDVLTFPLDQDRLGRITSGEIVICIPYARRAAAAAGTDLRRELLLYAIHGVLHLAGYDDRTRRGFVRMHQREDRILSELGVGPVFEPAPRRATGPRRPAPRSRRSEGTGRR